MNKQLRRQIDDDEGIQEALEAFEKNTGISAEWKSLESAETSESEEAGRVLFRRDGREYVLLPIFKKWITNESLAVATVDILQKGALQRVLITRYVTPQQAERLKQAKVQFIDTAGNAFIDQPHLLVYITGKRLETREARRPIGFKTAGIKLLYALLTEPGLIEKPYREITSASAISLGAVHQVLDELKSAGYLLEREGKKRILSNRAELIRRWVEAYAERLRPKIILGRYTAAQADWWKNTNLEEFDAYWGGEVAAAKLTKYLQPEIKTIYAPNKLPLLQVRLDLRPAPNGEIEILKKFWVSDVASRSADIVSALLIYADLTASGESRNIETARIIYDEYLDRSF